MFYGWDNTFISTLAQNDLAWILHLFQRQEHGDVPAPKTTKVGGKPLVEGCDALLSSGLYKTVDDTIEATDLIA